MITIRNLTKKYGNIYAIRDLTFDVKKGEIIGFLGPNGAGKSTTMNILTGYIPSTSGDVEIGGYNIMDDPMEVKKRIGYLPEIPPLYLDMRVIEYLNFVADLKKVKKKERKEQLGSIMEKLKIEDVKNRKIQNLSKGYKQRVGLAQALIGNPEVLILDEPTVGLDPKQIIEIREFIKNLGNEHTVILSSHILSEVSAICSRVIIINKGEILAVDTPSNLANRLCDKKKLEIKVEASDDKSNSIIKNTEGIKNVEVLEEGDGYTTYKLECEPDVDVEKNLFFNLADEKIPIKEIKNLGNSLEEIFLEIVESNKKLVQENQDETEAIDDQAIEEDSIEEDSIEDKQSDEQIDTKSESEENIEDEKKEVAQESDVEENADQENEELENVIQDEKVDNEEKEDNDA